MATMFVRGMKKVIFVSLAVLLAGCAGGFLPIDAPSWEKGQNYTWDIFAEGSGSVSVSEPGSPPVNTVIPPMVLLEGNMEMTILEVVNETFKWYPTVIKSTITEMPEFDPYTDSEEFSMAIRGSDLAQAQIFVEDNPFKVTPGVFNGGFEFPIDPDFRIEEDLEPSMPGTVVLVIEAGATDRITTPAGTFDATSLVWRIEVDEAAIEEMAMERGGLTTFSMNVNIGGAFWFSPETQWLVKSTAQMSGSFSATYDSPEGTYKASGSGNLNFDMSLTSHGLIAVPTLEEYFSQNEPSVYVPIIGDSTIQETSDAIATTLVLSKQTVNAAVETSTASIGHAGEEPVPAVFYMYDLEGRLIDSSAITSSWELPAHTFGAFFLVADVVSKDYWDPEYEAYTVSFDGEISNDCSDLTLPLPGDCTGSTFQVSHGISELSAASESVGLHTLTITDGTMSTSSPGVLTSSASINAPYGAWTVTGEGDLGTGVTVTVTTTFAPELSSLDQASFELPTHLQQTPQQGTESVFAPLMQLLPEWLLQSVDLQNIETELGHLAFAGTPLGSR